MPIGGSSGGLSSAGPGAGGGAQGPQGATGSQGTQGHQGTQGNQGTQGSGGAQGSQGNQGTTGAQGPQGGTSVQGASIVRKFPFAFNTPGILTGAALYTPTVGDVLLDAWIEIDTAWDGTTPLGDLGTFVGTGSGIFGNDVVPIDMTVASSPGGYGDGLTYQFATLASLTALGVPQTVLETRTGLNPVRLQFVPPSVDWTTQFGGPIPARFTAADPIKVCVSEDGTNTGANPGSTQGAGVLYLVTATPV